MSWAHDSALELSWEETSEEIPHTPPGGNMADNQEEDENNRDRETEEFDDNDSAFGGSLIGSDTETLASFITDYRYKNGRRYHAYRDGDYWVPFPSSPR